MLTSDIFYNSFSLLQSLVLRLSNIKVKELIVKRDRYKGFHFK